MLGKISNEYEQGVESRMSGPTRPNVIVFFTDQQRWDTTGVHGNPLELTANFDRMASEGTHIYHSFTCQPVCGPARSCLQTGLYATTTGCYRNSIPLPTENRTLAHYFKDAGYSTGYIGKWHLAANEPVPEEERGGYEYWLGANLLEFTSDAYDTIVYNNENKKVKLPGYRVDALTDKAINYINDHQEDPFFLFVSYLEPHHQNHFDNYPAPIGYEGKYTGRWTPPDLDELKGNASRNLGGYYGMVKRLDEALGRMMDALRSLGQLENTIILFTSDHGNHFKTRNNEYKRSCHDSSIRVPTAIYGPGFMSGGQLRDMVSLVDLPPTLLDAAGIEVPEVMQGKSVMPLLRGDRESWPKEVFVQISETQVGRAIRTERYKYGVVAPEKNGNRDSGSDVYEETYFYDLDADPYELDNLIEAAEYQDVLDDLRTRLLSRMVEAGEPPARIISASSKSSSRHKSIDDVRRKYENSAH
jgi:arylsulfatase A-like enzyme